MLTYLAGRLSHVDFYLAGRLSQVDLPGLEIVSGRLTWPGDCLR